MNLHDEIARIACELYEKSGRVEGRDEANWLEAERIVMTRTAKKSGSPGMKGSEETPKNEKTARTSSRKAEGPKKTPAKRKKKTG